MPPSLPVVFKLCSLELASRAEFILNRQGNFQFLKNYSLSTLAAKYFISSCPREPQGTDRKDPSSHGNDEGLLPKLGSSLPVLGGCCLGFFFCLVVFVFVLFVLNGICLWCICPEKYWLICPSQYMLI